MRSPVSVIAPLLRTTSSRPTLIASQPLPLYHDPLVAYVDKRLEPLNQLVLLRNLGLQPLDLLLGILLHLVHILPRLGELPPEIRPNSLLGRRVGLAVYRRPVLREACFHLLRIAVDRRSRVVDVPGQDRGVRVLALQDLERLADTDT